MVQNPARVLRHFEGISYTSVSRPDSNGDVGPRYYIQMSNAQEGSVFVIYDKEFGSIEVGATYLDEIARRAGVDPFTRGVDPIVIYDHLADRWVMSEMRARHIRVYVSQTADPISGGWYVYEYVTPLYTNADYAKLALWTDAYLITSNGIERPVVMALERDEMLAGQPGRTQCFVGDNSTVLSGFTFQTLTPVDLDGPAPPPGTPATVMRHRDDELHPPRRNSRGDYLDYWTLDLDWDDPAHTLMAGPFEIEIESFDSQLCASVYCVPQPNGMALDSIPEVLMWRLQYRQVQEPGRPAREAIVGSFVTEVGDRGLAGVRWFDLERHGFSGLWSLRQEGLLASDPLAQGALHRWLPTIAMDGEGNLALGYNVSNDGTGPRRVYPGLRYSGRMQSDPLGALSPMETVLAEGAGVNPLEKFGDYSSMVVDPEDNKTFWFTGSYVTETGLWSTRIAAFTLDGSGSSPQISGTVVFDADADGSFETLAAGIKVYLDIDGSGTLTPGDIESITDGTGFYEFSNLAPGEYTVRAAVDEARARVVSPVGGSHRVILYGGSGESFWKDFQVACTGATCGEPKVRFEAPATGAVVPPGMVGVSVFADDPQGIRSVSVAVKTAADVLLGTLQPTSTNPTTKTWGFQWNVQTPGDYKLDATAVDNGGRSKTESNRVTVRPPIPVVADGAWLNAAPVMMPSECGDGQMVDTDVGVLLFGGSTGCYRGTTDELWQWDGAEWNSLTPSPRPAAWPASRAGFAMAYDSDRRRLVVVGGKSIDLVARDDVWEYDVDSRVWQKVSATLPPGCPIGEVMGQMFYDSTRKRTFYFTQDELWLWDGISWARESLTGGGPPLRSTDWAAAYDQRRRRVYVFTDRLWLLEGSEWRTANGSQPPPAPHPNLVYDTVSASLLLYRPTVGLHQWDGQTWVSLQTPRPWPPNTVGPLIVHYLAAFDARRSRLVLFMQSAPQRETWIWKHTTAFHPPRLTLARAERFPDPFGHGIHLEWTPSEHPQAVKYEIEFATRELEPDWTPYQVRPTTDGAYSNHHGSISCETASMCLPDAALFYYRVRTEYASGHKSEWSDVISARVTDYLGFSYLVGDWNQDRRANLAVLRGNRALMDFNFDATFEKDQAYGSGAAEDEYLVGDWDGDGKDNLAVRRGNRILMDLEFTGGAELEQSFGRGNEDDQYLVGDWDGDGRDNLGVRRGSCVSMDFNFDAIPDREQCYGIGKPESQYLVGDWDGDGRDNLAVRRGSCVLMDFDFAGGHERQQCYGMGSLEAQYLVGDWDGDGRDNLAVRRATCVLMDFNFDGAHEREQCYGSARLFGPQVRLLPSPRGPYRNDEVVEVTLRATDVAGVGVQLSWLPFELSGDAKAEKVPGWCAAGSPSLESVNTCRVRIWVAKAGLAGLPPGQAGSHAGLMAPVSFIGVRVQARDEAGETALASAKLEFCSKCAPQ